jgi:hypothetical protein
MGVVEFPNGMEQKALSLADQVMIAGIDGGKPTLATIQQFKNLLVAISSGQVIPQIIQPGAVLGTPADVSILYAKAGTYTLPTGNVQLTGNLNMFIWDKRVWSYIEVPVNVDLSAYAVKNQLQYRGTFESVAQAIAGVPLAQRKLGDTVLVKDLVNGLTGYIWKKSTADGGLIKNKIQSTKDVKLNYANDARFNPHYEEGVGEYVGFPINFNGTHYTGDFIKWEDGATHLIATYFSAWRQYNAAGAELNSATVGWIANPALIAKNADATYIRLSVPLEHRFNARATFASATSVSLKTTEPIKFKSDGLLNGESVAFKAETTSAIERSALPPTSYAVKEKIESNLPKWSFANEHRFNPHYELGVGVRLGGDVSTPENYFTTDYIIRDEAETSMKVTWLSGYELYNATFGVLLKASLGAVAGTQDILLTTEAKYIRITVPISRRYTARAVFTSKALVNAAGVLLNTGEIALTSSSKVAGENTLYKPDPAYLKSFATKDEIKNIPIYKVLSRQIINPNYDAGVNVGIGTYAANPTDRYTTPFVEYGDISNIYASYYSAYEQYDSNFAVVKTSSIGAVPSAQLITKAETAKYIRFCSSVGNRYLMKAVFTSNEADFLSLNNQEFTISGSKNNEGALIINEADVKTFKTIEDFNKFKNVGSALVGNILVKSNKDVHGRITNMFTQLDYDIVNFDKKKPQGVITNRKYYPIQGRMLWYSYRTGRVYFVKDSGTDINIPLMSNSIEDFINKVYTVIKGDYEAKDGIIAIRELDNGELLLAENQSSSTIHRGVYVSSGMNTNPTGLVWTKKIEYLSFVMAFAESWGLSIRGNHIMVTEYNSNRKENSGIWYSDDYAKTFKMVATTASLNTYSGTPELMGQHIHGVCYDPYWSRLWIILGEGARTGQHVLAFSDDKGTSWTRLGTDTKTKSLVGNGREVMKFCGGHAFPSGVIFTTDSQPNGFWRYNRVNKFEADLSQAQYLEEAKRIDLFIKNTTTGQSGHEDTITHIGGHFIPSENGDFYTCNVPYVGLHVNTNAADRSSLIYFTQDGVKFYEIYREEDLPANSFVESFKDGAFKSFALKDGRIVVFSTANPRFKANPVNGDNCLMIGNMPSIV